MHCIMDYKFDFHSFKVWGRGKKDPGYHIERKTIYNRGNRVNRLRGLIWRTLPNYLLSMDLFILY
jgi:hypothetical protein